MTEPQKRVQGVVTAVDEENGLVTVQDDDGNAHTVRVASRAQREESLKNYLGERPFADFKRPLDA